MPNPKSSPVRRRQHRSVGRRVAISQGILELSGAPADEPPAAEDDEPPYPDELFPPSDPTPRRLEPPSLDDLRRLLKRMVGVIMHLDVESDDEGGRMTYWSLSLHQPNGPHKHHEIRPEDAREYFYADPSVDPRDIADTFRIGVSQNLQTTGDFEEGVMQVIHPLVDLNPKPAALTLVGDVAWF